MVGGWRSGVMAAAAAGALLVACSSDSNGSDGEATSTVEATTASAEASTAAGAPEATATVEDATPAGTFATNTADAGAPKKVSANHASREEIAAALEAAGVSNADRWAREVQEYRPYPEDDPDMAKLRGELAKYNPADGVVDAIVATLSLP